MRHMWRVIKGVDSLILETYYIIVIADGVLGVRTLRTPPARLGRRRIRHKAVLRCTYNMARYPRRARTVNGPFAQRRGSILSE